MKENKTLQQNNISDDEVCNCQKSSADIFDDLDFAQNQGNICLEKDEKDQADTNRQSDAESVEKQSVDTKQTAKKGSFDDKPRLTPIQFVLIALCVIVAMLLLSVGFKNYVFSNYRVQQSSMEPTYHENDVVWVLKIAKPKVNDIVLVEIDDIVLIKRLVGRAGDKLWVEQSPDNPSKYYLCRQLSDGTVERLVDEEYDGIKIDQMNINAEYSSVGVILNNDGQPAIGQENAFVVPDNGLYCLGDNRTRSLDSRVYGAFDEQQLVGVVVAEGMDKLWIMVAIGAALIAVFAILSFCLPSKKRKQNTDNPHEEEEYVPIVIFSGGNQTKTVTFDKESAAAVKRPKQTVAVLPPKEADGQKEEKRVSDDSTPTTDNADATVRQSVDFAPEKNPDKENNSTDIDES